MHDKNFDEARLTELQEELKTVPAEEREARYEEMVVDGGFNPLAEDDDPHALITQLKDEEGDSLRDRIINYLLAFIPLFVIPFLLIFVNIGTVSPIILAVWVIGGFSTLFALIGHRRRSDLLAVHWLGNTFGQIGVVATFMMTPLLNQVGVGVFGLLVLGWLGRLIYKNRHDNLFVAFATFPLVSQLVWSFGQPLIFRYLSLDQVMEITGMVVLRSLLSFVLIGVALGLLFIGRQRSTKWIGLFVSVFSVIISQLMFVLIGFSSFSLPALLIILLTSLILISMPAFFFWRDGRPKEKHPDDFTAEPSMS